MRVHLVTYATWRYRASQKLLVDSAVKFAVEPSFVYSRRDIVKTDLYAELKNQHFRHARGAGYWVWKPYLILKVLRQMNPDDRLLYLDAGIRLAHDLSPLIDPCHANSGIVVFRIHNHLQSHWTKRDCFVHMGCDEPRFHDVEQVASGYLLLEKNDFTLNLLEEWLAACKDLRNVSDDPSTCGLPELPGFREHRHDQSILTNLLVKHGVSTFRDASQEGTEYKGCSPAPPMKARGWESYACDYPQLFELHRMRRPSWRTALRLLVSDRQRFIAGFKMHIRRILGLGSKKKQ